MAAPNIETKKRLALSIIDFLNTSLKDGTLASDDKESIEVATSCIADSFKVDPAEKSTGPADGQTLLSIYSVYENLRGKTATASTPSAADSTSSTPKAPAADAAKPNPEAETLKGQGNVAMQQKDYASAIDFYSRAISLSPTNPIYLSNRAAAYSATQQHDLAQQDAEMAVATDPKYTKAWSRLGLARFALGDAKGSMEAYKSGIDAEGKGGSDAMKKGYETAKRKYELQRDEDDVGSARSTSPPAGGMGGVPDLGSLASMLGGGGGGGGMPDFSQIMNNPMMRNMAQSLMQNPQMMETLMSNPRLRDMANSFGGGAGAGGGMPDLTAMMNDPSIAEMARSFMGGGGAPPGAGPGRGANRDDELDE